MKQILLSIFLLFSLTTISAQTKSEKENVELTVKSAFDALAELNLETMKSSCTPDLLILENGIVWNMDTIAMKISALKTIPDFKRTNKFDFFDTQIRGNTAWTCYHNEATGVSKGKSFEIKWLESAILIKEKGSWKISMIHSSLISRK